MKKTLISLGLTVLVAFGYFTFINNIKTLQEENPVLVSKNKWNYLLKNFEEYKTITSFIKVSNNGDFSLVDIYKVQKDLLSQSPILYKDFVFKNIKDFNLDTRNNFYKISRGDIYFIYDKKNEKNVVNKLNILAKNVNSFSNEDRSSIDYSSLY